MNATRDEVFETLAAATDPDGNGTVTAQDLAAALGADEEEVAAHLRDLVACELAVRESDDEFRVSVTGAELRALDVENPILDL